ncbi:hypothetical protein [Actinokineospora sp. HUAS TT18]|uniref:hypothetical protein n=1 Tax=Actinokineospora sp. HUAS TT18 TaxID=3447451 RepID=UPI003F51D16D
MIRTAALTVQIADPRVDPRPDGWAEFARDLYPVWDYDLLGIEAWHARNPPVLAVLRDGPRVVGGLAVMVCRTLRAGGFAPAPTGRTRSLRPRWAEAYLPLLSGYPACVTADDVPAADLRALIRAFERALAKWVGPGLLGVMYRAMGDDVAAAAGGRARAYRRIDPIAVLTNTGMSVPDWLESLAPECRAVIDRLAADPGLVTEAAPGRTDLDAPELAAMLNAHRARQDQRAWDGGQPSRIGGLHLDTRSPVAPAYLDAFVRRPEVITRTYRTPEGTLLGFNTMIDHPRGVAMHHWAATPASQGGVPYLYADAYARCVRHMIDNGRPELTAGRALLDVKRRFGFGTRELATVAVPRPVMGR